MSKKEKTQIGDIIKLLRKEKGFTQKTFASEINIPRTTYANYEANKREPSIEMLKKIAKALEVPLDILIKMSQLNNNVDEIGKINNEMHETIKEFKAKVKSADFKKEYVMEILEDIMNDDIKFATFIIKRFFSKRDSIQERNFYENYTNEMTLSESTNILNSIENTLEFEIYKIKHNKE